MRTRINIIVVGCFGVAIVICCCYVPEQIAIWAWNHADIRADVLSARASGDNRFWGYHRAGMLVPGVKPAMGDPVAENDSISRHGVKFLPKISCTEGFGTYLDAAVRYAEEYNKLLLELSRVNDSGNR
jgi:hypothetical protein